MIPFILGAAVTVTRAWSIFALSLGYPFNVARHYRILDVEITMLWVTRKNYHLI
jgi:hypothetical protein